MSGVSQRKASDEEIVRAWDKNPSAVALARIFGTSQRAMKSRLADMRTKGVSLPSPDPRSPHYVYKEDWGHWQNLDQHPGVVSTTVENGVVMVGSDSHYWPGEPSTAHKAFVLLCRKLDPKVVVKNGDELDFPRLSRFAPIGWEKRPEVVQEIECAQERLGEIEKAAPNALKTWPIGNHDARFETKLATMAPEYARVNGVHLKDHFPMWRPCWQTLINNDVIIKHRFRNGIHATYNNTLHSGRSIITGHLHAMNIRAHSDYNGTRYGVDCGTLADPYGPQFYNYTETNPMNWRSGFVVLTFKDTQLLWPEICFVRSPGEVEFRGEVISV